MTLTEQQLGILRWISEGCPAGVMKGNSHRISAAALRSRRLIKTSGHGPTWSATITAAGREHLAKVDSDELDEPDDEVPPTKQLKPGRKAARPGLVEIAIPATVDQFHPVAMSFRDDRLHHEVSSSQLQRAVRIVHVIAMEAERRGWSVAPSIRGGDREDGSATDGRLGIVVGDHEFRLYLREKGVRQRGAWEFQMRRDRESALPSVPGQARDPPAQRYDDEATGELILELATDEAWTHRGRQRRWRDRASWRLEERLPHVFREIEGRIAVVDELAERKHAAARREEEARQGQWRALMDDAKKRLMADERRTLLFAQERAWRDARSLREYCDAMEVAHGEHPDTAEWLAWARDFADGLDPLSDPPSIPGLPEGAPGRLQEYLPDGWSVHGPQYRDPRYRRFG